MSHQNKHSKDDSMEHQCGALWEIFFMKRIPLPVTFIKGSMRLVFLNDSCLLLAESMFITQSSASLLVK